MIDREHETERLRELQAAVPSFSVITGRRRVGKSYLLSEGLRRERIISFQADEQPLATQLALLAAEAGRLLPGAPPLLFASWDEALRFFDALAQAAPLTLVLDEFQFLCQSEPALPSIIMHWWDMWQRQKRAICLIVCGSALSFMESLVSSRGAFYGRADWRPLLQPLDFRAAAGFAASSTAEPDLIERYGVLGGTPQYQAWAGPRPLSRIIREIVLTKGAPLYEEPLNLLHGQENIRQPATYFGVLLSIATGNTHNSQIAAATELPAHQTFRLLDRLRDLGYVTQVAPVGFGEKASRAYWRLADPYFHFWFRYVFKNRSRLERGLVKAVYDEIQNDFSAYVGQFVFEDCCREWASRFSPLAGEIREIGSWWSRRSDVEIDVVGTGSKDYLLLGSCKWTREVRDDALDALYTQRAILGPKAARSQLVLFGKDRFHPKVRERAEQEGVWLISAKDLFAPSTAAS